MEAALRQLVPKIISLSFDIHAHEGKRDLLQKLPHRLRGYRAWLPENWGVVVLLDEDREDCRKLKADMEAAALRAGFVTRSRAQAKSFAVVNWLAVEELEAWFLGDVPGLAAAYPGIPVTLGTKAGFRDPDAVKGGTWEALEAVLKGAGYHRGGLNKIEAARQIAQHMKPETNRSRSFRGFVKALCGLASKP